ncbi:MAG TPA: glycoside hydrolase family 97 C-terminal domain-containing protein [Tenuifilaceae bacterium]|nr:glycoside hydrolase family 97 C-terminal domain-containing protein [Tenuifilaceae bacterium]
MYVDAPDAHWNDNPTAYEIKKLDVDSNSELQLKLAPGGGAAISILPR